MDRSNEIVFGDLRTATLPIEYSLTVNRYSTYVFRQKIKNGT